MSSEIEVKDIQDQNYFYLLALLTSMPFHHLISAQEIHSSLSSKARQSNEPITIPSIYESPNERLKLFQSAVLTSVKRSSSQLNEQRSEHQLEEFSILLDRFIQLGFTDTVPNGEKFEFDWQVIFNDELQGCAEIYRAEMLIFKRMLYEQEENLKSPLKLTNENFYKYLDYELFDILTKDETEKLLINSLSAKYRISTTANKESNETVSNHRAPDGYINKKRLFEATNPGLDANLSILTSRLRGYEQLSAITHKKTDNNEPIIYKLNLGAYWIKWRQAARLTKFDFEILETLDDVRTLRFYELTKLLRLASYDETTRTLPSELKIDYESFTLLMPLPRLKKEVEIKTHIKNLTAPLKKVGYLKSISYKSHYLDQKNKIINFKFN